MISAFAEMSLKLQANSTEASSRLNALCTKLTYLNTQMQDATHEEKLTLLESMARDTVSTTQHCRLRKRVEGVLQSLKFDKIAERRSSIPEAHQNTFRWALSGPATTLPGWLRSRDGIYWVQGKAGSGKSTLMKFLQQEPLTTVMLKEWADGGPLLFVSHYFWAPGTELQRSLPGLFRTLLFQIFMKDPELVEKIAPSRMDQNSYGHLEPWSFDELAACFSSLSEMATLPSKICFFIDGLDEFQGEYDDLVRIIRLISNSKHMKICVASRPWVPFQQAFGQGPHQLSVHDLTIEDIDMYVRENLSRHAQYSDLQAQFPAAAESLVGELTRAADGVFLWVYLVVRDLLSGLSNRDDISTLTARLRDMPQDLEHYFTRMLYAIDQVYWAETSALFSILIHTGSPLTTYLTWAHRKSRSPGGSRLRDHGTEISPMLPVNGLTAKSPRLPPRGFLSNAPAHDGIKSKIVVTAYEEDIYDAQAEKIRVIARCKDLIHVSEDLVFSDDDPVRSYRVGFLHRTVADFLALATTQDILQDRLVGATAHRSPTVALARTYLELLCSPFGGQDHVDRETIDSGYYRWVLYLVMESRKHSLWDYLPTMHNLCNDLANLPDLVTPPDYGSNLAPANPIAGTRNFALLVATMIASIAPMNNSLISTALDWSDVHSKHGRLSGTSLETFFLVMHCPRCLADCNKDTLMVLLGICFLPQPIPAMGKDGTLSSTQRLEIDLYTLRRLVKIIEQRDSLVVMEEAWCTCLMNIWTLNDYSIDFPTNIHHACRIIIQHGAPRWAKPPWPRNSTNDRQWRRIGRATDPPTPVGESVDSLDVLTLLPVAEGYGLDQFRQDFDDAESVSRMRQPKLEKGWHQWIGLQQWLKW